VVSPYLGVIYSGKTLIAFEIKVKALEQSCNPQGVIFSGKTLIAFEIKVKALEQSCNPQNTITAPLGGFDLVVQAFHEAAAATISKVVGDFIQPIIERSLRWTLSRHLSKRSLPSSLVNSISNMELSSSRKE